MKLYPAIDLKEGQCVRLYQGDYDQKTVYGDNPVAQAQAFVAEGAKILHLVDLDAAKTGEPTNRSTIADVCKAVDVPVQVGGGVRSVASAEALFSVGVSRVVIGTAAVENPELVSELASSGHQIVVGIDSRNGYAATHGWTEASDLSTAELANRFVEAGVAGLVVTDIGRDGTQQGPDVEGLSALLAATQIPVIASGGVGAVADLVELAKIDISDSGGSRQLAGVIVGRALYEGSFDVKEALAALDSAVFNENDRDSTKARD